VATTATPAVVDEMSRAKAHIPHSRDRETPVDEGRELEEEEEEDMEAGEEDATSAYSAEHDHSGQYPAAHAAVGSRAAEVSSSATVMEASAPESGPPVSGGSFNQLLAVAHSMVERPPETPADLPKVREMILKFFGNIVKENAADKNRSLSLM
jgi:hypothetical protein